MAIFPLRLSGTLVETTQHPMRVQYPSPGSDVAGAESVELARAFRLSLGALTWAEAETLGRFYRTTRFGLDSFEFLNPNDGLLYRCRFAGALPRAAFLADFIATDGLTLVVVSE